MEAIRAAGRFTPTGVGKSIRGGIAMNTIRVHPHGRGEKAGTLGELDRARGSPPRAWGKVAQFPTPAMRTWFTPTGVGKSNDHRKW